MWAGARTRDNREEMRVDISVAREALERAAAFTLVRGTTLPTTVLMLKVLELKMKFREFFISFTITEEVPFTVFS